MKTINWVNPFTGMKQKVRIDKQLINDDGTLKIPEVLNTDIRDAFSLAIDGLQKAAMEGKTDAMKHLMFFLLRQLNDDGKHSSRKFDYRSLTKSLKNEDRSNKDYFQTMHKGIKEKATAESPYVTYCQQIAHVIFDPFHKKGIPRRGQIELTSDEFNALYTKITKAYSETYGVGNDDQAKMRNFRTRLKSKNSLGNSFEALRDEATIYESYFHHKVARSFLDAVILNDLYPQLSSEIYTFLHLENESPQGLKSPLKYVPPLASLQIYPLINKTYMEVFKRSLLHDLASSINKRSAGNQSDHETFLLNIAGIIKWYHADYLNLIRNQDKQRSSFKKSGRAIHEPTPDQIRAHQRLVQIKGNVFASRPSEMREKLNCLTPKQKECYYLYLEGKSLDEMANFLNITKDSVRDRLKGAKKKIIG